MRVSGVVGHRRSAGSRSAPLLLLDHRRTAMELRFAFVAESADLSSRGKFNVLGGGIEYLNCTELPWYQPLAFVAKIRLSPVERNKPYTAEIQFVRPTGEVFTATKKLLTQVDDVPIDLDAFDVVIVTFCPMEITGEGVHEFRLSVGDKLLGAATFRACLVRPHSPDERDSPLILDKSASDESSTFNPSEGSPPQ